MPNNSKPWETLQPGAQWQGRLDTGIADLPPVPVLAARGKRDGPRVTIFGAVHGDEYEGTAAIHALFHDLAATARAGAQGASTREEPCGNPVDDLSNATVFELRGLVIGVPVANPAAWLAQRRTTPQDGLDLNRTFPGDPSRQAPITHRLAHLLFHNFVAPADVSIDLHSGGVRLNHLPMIGWGADSDGRAEALARIFGFDFYPWQVGATPGVLTHEATRAGKIALGAEWGGGASLDPAGMGAYATGLRRILSALEPTAPWSYAPDTRPPLQGDYAATPVAGIFHPVVRLGQQIAAGAALGTVVDDLGAEQALLTSERAGLVAGLAHRGRLTQGDRYIYVG